MNDVERLQKLHSPTGKCRMVLDTDTYNEVDDQFALAYTVRCAEEGLINLLGVYAAPFSHIPSQPSAQKGMELSYLEILNVLEKLGRNDLKAIAFRGSERYMENKPVDSPAVRDLIRLALASPEEDPLYVVAIGTPTNISSAIAIDPAIIDHIIVVWLGGTPHYWPYANEYNLQQDPTASRILFDSGVPLIQLPTANVISHMLTTIPELEEHLEGKSDIGSYLTGIVRDYSHGSKVWSKVIWDVTAVAWLMHPEWFSCSLQHTPRLLCDPAIPEPLLSLDCYKDSKPMLRWAEDRTRPLFCMIESVNRDAVYKDLFERLGK